MDLTRSRRQLPHNKRRHWHGGSSIERCATSEMLSVAKVAHKVMSVARNRGAFAQFGGAMIKSEGYRFSYTRTQGLGRTYGVTVNVARRSH
ncbi:hypothetical protein BN2476_190002 [Paraburkholderia piptadeniae]|uniref:Uncharacterized protein n=1 Tax=Paraburkholderia piptadeniae TaxID=1701573 RepID=A0A1N7RUH6_9BURK|nr:hypothetical protein BN2476_190002 [Paraburkholderia piptadeniae]